MGMWVRLPFLFSEEKEGTTVVPEPLVWHLGPCVPVILLRSTGIKGCVSPAANI